MHRITRTTNWVGACLALTLAIAKGAEAPRSQGLAGCPAEMNKAFTDPNVDVQGFVKRFENDARDDVGPAEERFEEVRSVHLSSRCLRRDLNNGGRLLARQIDPRRGNA